MIMATEKQNKNAEKQARFRKRRAEKQSKFEKLLVLIKELIAELENYKG